MKTTTLTQGIYPVLDTSFPSLYEPYALAEQILSAGCNLLQLRGKNLTKPQFLSIAQEIAYLKIHNPFTYIINTYIEIAAQVGADGVHLPENADEVQLARKVLGEKALIGCSVHSVEAGLQKEKEGADYLTFGCIFPSESKPSDHPVQGLEKLQELMSKVKIPVVAIGGINLDNILKLKETGVKSFSILGQVLKSENPRDTLLRYQKKWT